MITVVSVSGPFEDCHKIEGGKGIKIKSNSAWTNQRSATNCLMRACPMRAY